MTVPIQVVLGEAIDLAVAFNTHWNPTLRKKGPNLPGFAGVAQQSDITENTGSDICELVAAAGHANAVYHKAPSNSEASPMERAEFVLYEIKATLEFVFDDDEHTAADDQLELDSFDVKLLDEALVLVGALRMRSAEALVTDNTVIRNLLLDRNRLIPTADATQDPRTRYGPDAISRRAESCPEPRRFGILGHASDGAQSCRRPLPSP